MKANVKNVNKKSNKTLNNTLKFMGIILAVLGFIMIVYAVFNKPNFESYRQGAEILVMGIALFMVGGTMSQLFVIPEDSYDDEAIMSLDGYSLVAWNETYLSWMKVVEFRKLCDWDFVLIGPSGEETSDVIKSEDRFNDYSWEKMTD